MLRFVIVKPSPRGQKGTSSHGCQIFRRSEGRLHQLLGKLVHWLEPEQLAWRDRDDSSVDLDGVEIDEEGSVSVNLSFHGWLWVNLEELMELVHRHAPAEVTEARSILEKLQSQPAPAPRKKAKKSRTRR